MQPIKTMTASAEHEACYQSVVEALRKHEKLPTIVQIALLSNIIGKLTAALDQRQYTADAVFKMVGHNIEQGNKHFIEQTMSKTEGSA